MYNGLTMIKLDYLHMEEITSLLKKLDNPNLFEIFILDGWKINITKKGMSNLIPISIAL